MLALLAAAPAFAADCSAPDQGDAPFRLAVLRVQALAETEAWVAAANRRNAAVRYLLEMDRTIEADGRCYWTLEASADGELWQRFYVTPDGRGMLFEVNGRPATIAEWRGRR